MQAINNALKKTKCFILGHYAFSGTESMDEMIQRLYIDNDAYCQRCGKHIYTELEDRIAVRNILNQETRNNVSK